MRSTATRERYREQREKARQDILDAADSLLRERPYHELSVELVMTTAGLARTAFYRHFDDLPDLVLRLLEGVLRDLYAIAEGWGAEAGPAFPAPAEAALPAIVEFFRREGRLLRGFQEAAMADDAIEAGRRRLREPFIALTTQTLDRLVAEGHVDVPDTRAVARALNLMTEAYLLEEFGREPAGDPHAALAALETVWLRTLAPRGADTAP